MKIIQVRIVRPMLFPTPFSDRNLVKHTVQEVRSKLGALGRSRLGPWEKTHRHPHHMLPSTDGAQTRCEFTIHTDLPPARSGAANGGGRER